ncbi:MAG: fasciclin domain-containing protein, partial [Bacteroidales bacterium]|nr:fasciclin domain-containing protein [Bacteroidales bacterium]
MKKTVKHIAWSLPLLLLTAIACQDSWNQHYTYNKSLGGEDLLTTLKAEASYSRFVKLIEIAGLQHKLAGSGSFTVWAPHNDFIPDSIYTSTDTAFIKDVVHNHIAYFLHSTSEAYAGSNVMMLNGKYINFAKLAENDFFFG